MAAQRWDQGVLDWLILAAVAIGGAALCGLGAYIGTRAARFVDDNRPEL